jgi:hypothetical protein
MKDIACRGGPPPVLILAGWSLSSDFDKHTRWLETKKWAEDNGFEALVCVKDSEKRPASIFNGYEKFRERFTVSFIQEI